MQPHLVRRTDNKRRRTFDDYGGPIAKSNFRDTFFQLQFLTRDQLGWIAIHPEGVIRVLVSAPLTSSTCMVGIELMESSPGSANAAGPDQGRGRVPWRARDGGAVSGFPETVVELSHRPAASPA